MAVAAVDIVNAALRDIGAKAISSISDSTPAGAVAGDVLSFLRDALLRAHTWNFATARVVLERHRSANYEFEWAFKLPPDWIRTIAVHDNDAGAGSVRYKHESNWGLEIVTNGTFDEDSDWTKGGGWTIAGGKANKASGSATDLSQSITFVSGGIYRVTFTISGRSFGSVTPKFTGGATVTGTARAGNIIWVEHLTATAAHTALVISATSSFDGSIDDVSLIRTDSGVVRAILADADNVWLRYIRQVTDYDLMTPGFHQALIYLLAKAFATPLANSNTLREITSKDMRAALSLARSIDGIEDYPEEFPVGSWAEARFAGNWARGRAWPR